MKSKAIIKRPMSTFAPRVTDNRGGTRSLHRETTIRRATNAAASKMTARSCVNSAANTNT
jgi:hypothetical protein